MDAFVSEAPKGDTAAPPSSAALVFEIVTLFPEAFEGFAKASFIGRALNAQKLALHFHTPREFGVGVHKSIDDTPSGGGSGMVMRVDIMVKTIEAAEEARGRAHRVLLTPQGKPLHQSTLATLATRDHVMLICGRYEGFDERIRAHVDEEISLGDFVLTGGEVAAMAVIDGTIRLREGVLGNAHSTKEESHSDDNAGLLEYPQYTRPAEFRGETIPEILTGGNHEKIAKWRREQAILRTAARRPDLHARFVENERVLAEARIAEKRAKKELAAKTEPGGKKEP